MGVQRSYERVISIERLFLVPVVFILLSIKGVATSFELNITNILSWFLGITVGVSLGVIQVRKQNIKTTPREKQIIIPGDWSMLVLILCVFFIEFCIHYIIESGSTIATHSIFKILSVQILGCIAGTSFGRSICFFWKYKLATKDLR